jgi:hypothetical protein
MQMAACKGKIWPQLSDAGARRIGAVSAKLPKMRHLGTPKTHPIGPSRI